MLPEPSYECRDFAPESVVWAMDGVAEAAFEQGLPGGSFETLWEILTWTRGSVRAPQTRVLLTGFGAGDKRWVGSVHLPAVPLTWAPLTWMLVQGHAAAQA